MILKAHHEFTSMPNTSNINKVACLHALVRLKVYKVESFAGILMLCTFLSDLKIFQWDYKWTWLLLHVSKWYVMVPSKFDLWFVELLAPLIVKSTKPNEYSLHCAVRQSFDVENVYFCIGDSYPLQVPVLRFVIIFTII